MHFKNGKLLNDNFVFAFSDFSVEGGIFEQIGNVTSSQAEAVDLQGYTVIPGLVDIHTHECVGQRLRGCTIESLDRMTHYYAENGITSYLLTLDSQPEEDLAHICHTVREYLSVVHPHAATIRGIHLEGLFFCEKRRGGHPVQLLREPDTNLVRRLNRSSGGLMKMACVAPELAGATAFIKELCGEMTISIAHSDADCATAKAAIAAGAKSFTHLCNGMSPLHHRQPGVVGAALDSRDTYKELVMDSIHLAPEVARILFAAIHPERTVMISDSCMATGLSDGIYESGDSFGRRFVVENGRAYLEGTDTICGSTFNLMQMLRNAVQKIGIPLPEAVRACTINPARLIGEDSRIGSIKVGKCADFVVLDDSLSIHSVYINGQCV